jgi:hypothetical protein
MEGVLVLLQAKLVIASFSSTGLVEGYFLFSKGQSIVGFHMYLPGYWSRDQSIVTLVKYSFMVDYTRTCFPRDSLLDTPSCSVYKACM